MLFDIIIPLGPNDINEINKVIDYAKKNVIGYRNIYIITKLDIMPINNCIIIDESTFPFKIDNVSEIHGESSRNGWYLQQLLKLYAYQIIDGLLERYLIIDADTFFLRKVEFINPSNNKCLYNYSTFENYKPYYIHMKKLHEKLDKVLENSAICHHMIFEKKYVKELINLIEDKHKKPFWKVFLELVDKSLVNDSGASEYEIYCNYVFNYHGDSVELRELYWNNVSQESYLDSNYSTYDYVSYHWNLRLFEKDLDLALKLYFENLKK